MTRDQVTLGVCFAFGVICITLGEWLRRSTRRTGGLR